LVGETNESTELRHRSFAMYQDEFLARLSSGGALFGYTHLQFVPAEKRAEMIAEDTEVSEMIKEVGEINEIWREVRDVLFGSDVLPTDLIASIWHAKTFADIKTLAEKTLNSLNKL